MGFDGEEASKGGFTAVFLLVLGPLTTYNSIPSPAPGGIFRHLAEHNVFGSPTPRQPYLFRLFSYG